MQYGRHLDKLASNIANNSIIRAVRKGMLYMIPLTLIGSFALMLLNLPIPAFQESMGLIFGEHWRSTGLFIYNGTFQIMSITALISVSYCYASEHELIKSGEISQLCVVLTVLASYIAYCGSSETVINFSESSSTGLFQALIIAILGTEVFLRLYNRRLFRSQIISNDIDVVLRSSLHMVLPAFLTVFCFAVVRTLFDFFGISGWSQSLFQQMETLAASGRGDFLTVFLFIFVSHILWFFGFHGTNILDGVAKELFVTASDANLSAVAAGGVATEIFTKQFFDVFVYMGGCGATLGLLIASSIANHKKFNRLERYSFLPALFNINEILVYGIPVIYNPYLFIPFLLTPVVLTITTYLAMYSGLVPLTIARVEWTTPVLVSGYISTGSVAGILLQLFNLALAALLYLPFLKLYKSHQSRDSAAVFHNLTTDIQYIQESRPKAVLNRSDEVGIHARFLAEDIAATLRGETQFLHLEYQPKVDAEGHVVGAEALLRCNHPSYGYISPLVLLTVADEAESHIRLGRWILHKAIEDLQRWQELGYKDLTLSINVSPDQLREDDMLVPTIINNLTFAMIPPEALELELTENAAIDQSEHTHAKLMGLIEAGIGLAIDDFGMGHSSLLYLRDFHANVVKIDMSLVSSIDTDIHSQQIVRSICSLCRDLGVKVVAEGTETLAQIDKLQELGCEIYQGFYFSRSLPFDAFIDYLKKHGTKSIQHK